MRFHFIFVILNFLTHWKKFSDFTLSLIFRNFLGIWFVLIMCWKYKYNGSADKMKELGMKSTAFDSDSLIVLTMILLRIEK